MFSEEHVIYRYKYLRFSTESVKTLTQGTMKFTCPLEFNDPFDFLPIYDTTEIGQVPRLRPDLFKAAGKARGLTPAKRLQQKGQFVARLRNRIDDGSFAANMMKDVGVVSLSRRPLSILMWSHYADFHRGFLLEFRIPAMGSQQDAYLARDRLLPFPVTYSSQRPHIFIGRDMPHDLVNKVALTKSSEWAYEAEERVIDHERGPGVFEYRRDEVLCSVIAGMRMTEQNYADLDSAVSSLAKGPIPNLALYRAQPAKGDYALEVVGHPRISSGFIEAT